MKRTFYFIKCLFVRSQNRHLKCKNNKYTSQNNSLNFFIGRDECKKPIIRPMIGITETSFYINIENIKFENEKRGKKYSSCSIFNLNFTFNNLFTISITSSYPR